MSDNKQTPNYFLIRTQVLLQFQLDVGEFMDCGYVPLGRPDIHYHSTTGRCTFTQAMIKKEFK